MTESEFFMWRAVFSFAFVDSGLSMSERELLSSYLAKADFSEVQKHILKEDINDPPDVQDMYSHVTRPQDKEKFCSLARALAWSEGNIDLQERAILKKLSCFKGGDDRDLLMKSRDESHVHDYYQHYAKSGVIGLMSYPKMVEQRV